MDLDFVRRATFGVARASTLKQSSLTASDIRRMCRTGELEPLRHGWYAFPGADPEVRAAVRAGGVLSCVSALSKLGIWTPSTSRTHVRYSQHHQRTGGTPRQVTLRACGHKRWFPPTARGLDPVGAALSVAAGCLTSEELVAVADSALNQGRLTIDEVRDALAPWPAAIRRLADRCDARAESGTESLARFRLQKRNLRVRAQVRIIGVGRVDLLIGDRLVLEIDSRAHHTGELGYESDRRRDRLLLAADYLPLRASYRQVLFEWADVERSVLAIVRRGDHRRSARVRRLLRRAA